MIGGPVMTVSKADMLLAGVIVVVVAVILVRDALRLRRVQRAWTKAARIMAQNPKLVATEIGGGSIGLRRRASAGLMSESEAKQLLVAAFGVRGDDHYVVQVGQWWTLEKVPDQPQ